MSKTSYKDSMGRYRTQSLFWEMRDVINGTAPIWSMKDYDLVKEGITYPSLKDFIYELFPRTRI